MTYTTKQNSISKTKIDLIKIKMDYCNNSFGQSPCAANGTRCFNTFPSCSDQQNYSKGEKVYSFINADLPLLYVNEYFPSRPYIKSINDLPTEIKETNTVVKRLTVELLDEPDDDIGIDPYYQSRSAVTGTFWKKWIARNKNYKGRIIELYQGYAGLDEDDFQLKLAGRIETIKQNGKSVTIECTDMLKKLSEIAYPLKTSYVLKEDVPNIHLCSSQADMLELDAKIGDFAERSDFTEISIKSSKEESGNMEVRATYQWIVVAYDAHDRPIARTNPDGIFVMFYTTATINKGASRFIEWYAVDNASYYKVFYKEIHTRTYQVSAQITSQQYYLTSQDGVATDTPPITAERIFKYFQADYMSSVNWVSYTGDMEIEISVDTDLNNAGYVKIDKEIIYYSSKNTGMSTDTLKGVRRHQFNTDPDEHSENTIIYQLFEESAANPFYLLNKMLTAAGISSAYIDSKFTTYTNSWTGIDGSCKVIVKDTKLNKIFFDLVNALDCMSYVNESGLITILKHSERDLTLTKIKDSANIIKNSGKVDLNEGSRKTRFGLYYNRADVESDIEDHQAYENGIFVVDADAEHANEYGESIDDIHTTVWINDDCGTQSEIESYITALLTSRKNRMRNAQTIYECDLDYKDSDVQTGDIIELSTDDMQDQDGNAFTDVEFRIIKKTPKKNNFTIKTIKAE